MNQFYQKFKRFNALLAIIIILLLYVTTLVLAIMNNEYTKKFFFASLFASFFIPIMLYLIMWIAKVFRSYNPSADEAQKDPAGSPKENKLPK